MKLHELTIYEFLQRVDSNTATPGGGSVSALSVSLGISLIRMVAHLTISKKKFRELDEHIKLDYMSRIAALEELKARVIELIEIDTQAYNKIVDAYRLPKESDSEKFVRENAINQATVYATEIPLEIAKIAANAIELAAPTFMYANKTTTSDFGVGINMVYSGLKGAILNVKTNMHEYYDKALSDKYYLQAEALEKRVHELFKKADELVNIEFKKMDGIS